MSVPRFGRAGRIVAKALALFVALNLALVAGNPRGALPISLYNNVFPGRQRLPWGERVDLAYNLSLTDLDSMFASHEIARAKPADEFRVVLVGDSSTWGFLLRPEETLAAQLNDLAPARADGKRAQVYNLGYPDFSLTKDALIMQQSLRFQPDLIVWLVTLRSFPADAQAHALVMANPQALCELYPGATCEPAPTTWFERTLFGRRRALADALRLQLLGVMWAASGIDQFYPDEYTPAQRDLDPDNSFRGLSAPETLAASLATDVIGLAVARAGRVPVLLVNEPILISAGVNSAVRYNAFYPRWAYDRYRVLLADEARRLGVRYVDAWDAVPGREFTNSAVHLSPAGSRALALRLAAEIAR